MDLAQQLLKEHSKKNTIVIANYIGTDISRYTALWKIMSNGKEPLPQRSGWVFYTHIDDHPEPFLFFRKKAIDLLFPNIHQAVQRAICKMLFVSPIVKDPGLLVSKCFDLVNDPAITVAVKMYSIRILFKVGKIEPDLLPELALSLEENFLYGTAGLKNVCRKILTKIEKTKQG